MEALKKDWRAIRKSFSNMTDHVGLSLASAGLDAFTILAASFMFSFLFRKLLTPITTILTFVRRSSEGASEQELLNLIPSKTALNTLFVDMLAQVTLFILAILILWVFTQSVSWHIARRISERKEGPAFKNYLKRFAAASSLWFAAIYLTTVLFLRLGLRPAINQLTSSSALQISIFQQMIIAVGAALILAMLLAMPVSYILVYKKDSFNGHIKAFRKQKKNVKQIIIIYILLIAALALSQMMQRALAPFIGAMLLVGFLIDFGLIIMFRLTLMRIVEPEKA
ncbi:MAG: hypothetical protein ACOC32_01480 [Nanoarchaeota archaeon]